MSIVIFLVSLVILVIQIIIFRLLFRITNILDKLLKYKQDEDDREDWWRGN